MEDDRDTNKLSDETEILASNVEENGDQSTDESSPSRTIEIKLKTVSAVGGVFLASIVLGVGAYLFGKTTGEDLDAARTAGATAGKRAGTAKGTAQGYAAGFKMGRERGFADSYPPAYRKKYAQAFKDAGLEVPAKKQIDVPQS